MPDITRDRAVDIHVLKGPENAREHEGCGAGYACQRQIEPVGSSFVAGGGTCDDVELLCGFHIITPGPGQFPVSGKKHTVQ
jgi:hypothetical protein